MGGTGGGSGFNWQGAISGLMQLAGAGITANKGILGPILMMGGQMMAQNQESKRLRSMAMESAGSISGTPEEEQIQSLIRNHLLESPEQVQALLKSGRATQTAQQTALAIPGLIAPVKETESIPRAPVSIPREQYEMGERPGTNVTIPQPPETVTRTRESRLDEWLKRAEQEPDLGKRARQIAALTGMRAPAIDPHAEGRRQFEREASEGRFGDLTTTEGLTAARNRALQLGVPEAYREVSSDVPLRREMAQQRRVEQLKIRHESDIEALRQRPGFKESFADELRSAVGDEKGYEARRRSVIQAIDRQTTFDRQQERDESRFEATRAEKDETKRRQAASRELGYITTRMTQVDREFKLAEQMGDRVAMQQITDEMIRLQAHAAQFESILSEQAGVPAEAGPPVYQLGPGGQPQLVK